MTQPTKPTIDEQIEAAKALGGERGAAILAALERIKQAEAGLPVEPEIVGWLEHHKGGDNLNWERVDHEYAKADALIKKSDYDTLRAYAAQKEAENAALRKDAERYRWLRTHFRFANDSVREIWFDPNIDLAGAYGAHEPDELDAAIDQARTK